jgi:hypothetical protein
MIIVGKALRTTKYIDRKHRVPWKNSLMNISICIVIMVGHAASTAGDEHVWQTDQLWIEVVLQTYMSIDHYDVYGMYSWSVACEAVREHS